MVPFVSMRGRLLSSAIGCAIGIASVIGCGAPSRHGDDQGPPVDGSDFGPDGNNGCAHGAESIYTVDYSFNHLYMFDPPTKTFSDLGGLSCPTMSGAQPFSMGVDRSAMAWVLYTSGELFKVDINNHLACTKTTWSSPLGLIQFGMGFSTDTPGGTTDTLFISGNPLTAPLSYELAKVDPSSLSATMVATEMKLAEMTGNGNAELWGFMPDTTTPHVVQFDKTNGTFIKDFPEPMIARMNPGYAFAHWGGDYWVFIYEQSMTTSTTTTVYQVDGTNGNIKSTTPNTGRLIVGAGVSTCAPTVIL
jgi:hypothetical protein